MSDNKSDTMMWLESSIKGKPYAQSTLYRCPGIQNFVEKVQDKFVIVVVVFGGNNIGFITDKKN